MLDKDTVINISMKPGTSPLKSTRLMDQVRERILFLHYSLSTEKVYPYWVRFFIRWHGRGGQMQHPRDIGEPGVEAFFTMLATELKVSATSTFGRPVQTLGIPLCRRLQSFMLSVMSVAN